MYNRSIRVLAAERLDDSSGVDEMSDYQDTHGFCGYALMDKPGWVGIDL